MRIAICDDERAELESISTMIRQALPQAELCLFTSAEELFSSDALVRYAIFLMDIALPGQDGLAAAKRIRALCPEAPLIFITADESRVFEAFDVAAFHYLVKPIEGERLLEILQRAAAFANRNIDYNKSSNRLSTASAQTAPVLVKSGDAHLSVDPGKLFYIKSEGRHLILVSHGGETKIYGTLKHWEKMVGPGFFRCHRSYLVNMHYIRSYDSENIRLKDGSSIWLFKDRYGDFVQSYMRFLRQGGIR